MTRTLREWSFPVCLAAVWTIATAYTLAVAGLPW